MPDSLKAVEQKRDYYLQIMQKAQQLNDQPLINLILKKLARPELKEYEPPTWWTLFKLTLAVPGSLVALILLSYYRWLPG